MEEQKQLPVVCLQEMVVFPEMVVHCNVNRVTAFKAVEEAMKGNQQLFVTAQKDPRMQDTDFEDLHTAGTLVQVKQVMKLPQDNLRILVLGMQRGTLLALRPHNGYLVGDVALAPPEAMDAETEQIHIRTLIDIFQEFAIKEGTLTKEMVAQILKADSLDSLLDRIVGNSDFPFSDLQAILAEGDVLKRFEMVSVRLCEEMQILKVKEEIAVKVREKVDKHQREYILREQLSVIREELGESTTVTEGEEFLKAVEALEASEEVKEKLRKECKRYQGTGSPAENGVIRTYIETMLDMPWDKMLPEYYGISEARQLLDKEHYGLQGVKDRVLEYLAVRSLSQSGDAPILCLVGPPGTGKTSVAKSLAEAIHKPLVRISLGGVQDEAEIRGHRKTYVGAMPGRIAVGLKSAGVKNPLMLLDEIDKVGNAQHRGDTFSALLEVLDSEQHHKFRDHYLEVPIDLSQVSFLATANTVQTIPKPLLDRMELIEVHSYTDNEKMHIACRHLIPKQLKRHGLQGKVTISKGAVSKLIRHYTKEAGVRELERKIGDICRKAAMEILEENREKVQVTGRNLSKFLGKEIYVYKKANSEDEIGIVRGLAWTSVGGDTLQIEVNIMPGKGEVMLTGQMGDVMKESAMTGISCIRAISADYEIPAHFFETNDIHIHIPEGAVPKDGPSAGITMATAMISAITGRKVHADVAMTGEITLRGRILPVGGLKEKLLAAKNAGIRTVLIPKENERDIEELSAEIREDLSILPVSVLDEVLQVALCKEKESVYGH